MKKLPDSFRHVIFVLFLGILASPSHGQSPSPLSPDAACSGQLSRAAKFQVDFRVVIMPPQNTKKRQVWLPLPPSDNVQQVTDRQLSSFPRDVQPSIQTEPVFGNTLAYFEFDSPQAAQLISHRFTAVVQQVDWQVDYTSVALPTKWPASFRPYQQPDPRSKDGDQLLEVMHEIHSISVDR